MWGFSIVASRHRAIESLVADGTTTPQHDNPIQSLLRSHIENAVLPCHSRNLFRIDLAQQEEQSRMQREIAALGEEVGSSVTLQVRTNSYSLQEIRRLEERMPPPAH